MKKASTVLALALALSPALAVAETPLSKHEVIELFSGKTVNYRVVPRKLDVVAYFDPSGEARENRGGKKDHHPWWVKDDGRHCIQFKGKKPGCLKIVRKDDGAYVKYNKKGKLLVIYKTFEEGNTNNL
ncbi:MAG: hypothetical protein ABW120_09920 [Sedimenticola sp.]